MKSTIKFFGAVASMAALLVSCVKEELKNTTPDTVHMTIVAGSDDETRTVLDGGAGQALWSPTGERLAVWQNSSYAKSEEGVSSDNGETMTFGVSFTGTSASYSYYAVYPNWACADPDADKTSKNKVRVEMRQAQYPTATSFGPSSDILVAKPVTGLTERPSPLKLQFARMVAIGKMQIKDLNSTENVTRVTFTASEGKKLTGRSYIDVTAEVPTFGEIAYSGATNNVALAYNGENISANGMTAYFTCWPFSMAVGETFTVEVYTPSKYFTKTVTLPRELEFKQGRTSSFSVSFSGVDGIKRKDFNYSKLTYENFNAAGAKASYGLTTVKPEGDDGPIWDCYAFNNTSDASIQLRDNSKTNDSYIKLPTFKEKIRTVTVVVSSKTAAGAVISLEHSAAGTTQAISQNVVSGKTEYIFDLSGKEMKTAYLRVTGTLLYVTSVEAVAGEDTRTQLAAPSNIMAALVDGTPNSIEVVWDAVENAGSYVVTATPATGDAVGETVTEPSHTFTNLAYETEYTISVVAKPADAAAYKDSEAGIAENVTTGSKPAGETTYTLDNAAIVSAHSSNWGYTSGSKEITAKDGSQWIAYNTYYAQSAGQVTIQMNKGKSAYVMTPKVSGAIKKIAIENVSAQGGTGVGTKPIDVLSADGNVTVLDNVSGTTLTNGLEISGNYDQLKIICDETLGGATYIKSITIYVDETPDTREKLAAPANPTCSTQTDNSLTFTWNEVANASGYQVSLDGGSNWEVTQTETTYTWEGLSAGTTYTLYVKAIGDGINFKDSDAVSTEGTTTGESSGGTTKTFTVKSADVVGSSTYKAYTANIDNRDWIITFGGNNKSIGTNSGNRTKCNLSTYSKYAVSPVTVSSVASAFACATSLSNVSKISYAAISTGSGQANTKVYVLWSADGDNFSQLTLSTGTQGGTLNTAEGGEFAFNSCSGYFAVVFEATNSSGNWRIDDVNLTFTYSE